MNMTSVFTKKILVLVFFSLLCLISNKLFAQSSTIDQVFALQEKIESADDVSAELLWSVAIAYHSSDEEQKRKLLSNLQNEKLLRSLDSTSTKTTILNLSQNFYSEELLFVYLLNEQSKDERKYYFDQFYTDRDQFELKSLNEKLVNNELIKLQNYEFQDHPSLLFFLSEYTQTLDVVDSSLFDFIVDYRENFYTSSALSKAEKQLFLVSLFYAYYNKDQFDKIYQIYPELLNLDLFPVSFTKRNLYWSLDYVMFQLGHIDKSLEIQRKFTIPITIYLKDQSGLNSIYSSHGGYLYMLGKYQEARKVFQQALKWSGDLSNQNLTRLYNNLSLVYFSTGESSKYIETQLKALEHTRSYDNYEHQIKIYRNLHIFYRKNQNYDLSLEYINLAASLAKELDNTDDLISLMISKSVFESSHLNNFEKAEEYLSRAEELVNEETSSRYSTRILSEKAELYSKFNRHSKSLDIWNQVSDLALAQNNTSLYLESVLQAAQIEFNRGNLDVSGKQLRKFKTHDTSLVDFTVITLSKMLEARLAHVNGDFREAERLYNETTDLVMERARYSADQETGYWTVESEYIQLFEAYADFLIERKEYDRAVQHLDRIKTINDASMLQNPLITSSQLTEEQLTRDRQITQEMEVLRKRAFSATGSERLQLNTQLQRLQAQKRELHQHRQSFSKTENFHEIWSIQRTLGRNQVLLHVTDISNNYYVSKITADDISIQKIEIDEEHTKLFESAIESMITGRTDLSLLYEVGQLLGLQELSRSVKSIIMMADGYLHQLPIDVLPLNKPASPFGYGTADYLVESIDIRHLNNLGELLAKPDKAQNFERDFSGFGVADFQNESTGRNLITLPKAPGEIETISDHLSRFSNKSVYTDLRATPTSFRNAASNSRILHMATHSEISESDPLFSRIHLIPDADSEDPSNQIFAYELFDLNLNNELIMLNSCESGGDRAIQGSGIMGISRALHYAGAQSLILNAWSVNDQFAADFAEVFYKYINEGESKSRALQLTKIDFIKDKNSNPHFWGPYILNGNNDPLIPKRGTNFANWLIAVIFIAGFILVSRTRQSQPF